MVDLSWKKKLMYPDKASDPSDAPLLLCVQLIFLFMLGWIISADTDYF